MSRLLQANVNHCAAAQDLLCHSAAEWSIDLVIVTEPYYVPARSDWVRDASGLVAIVSGGGRTSLPLTTLGRGDGFIAVKWGEVIVVGVYHSPNLPLSDLERLLSSIEDIARPVLHLPVLVAGDLNAKHDAWGSPVTDAKGVALAEWAEDLGLGVLNRGREYTCVRHNGASVIDITLGSPAAARMVCQWRVLGDQETLSDHKYIRFDVSDPSMGRRVDEYRHGAQRTPRWARKQLDQDLLRAAAVAKAWTGAMSGPWRDSDEGAVSLRVNMTEICDTAMPRCGTAPRRRAAYWWTQELAELRAECDRARRSYTRCRRRHRDNDTLVAPLREAYGAKKKTLQRAIRKAKAGAWDELLDSIDQDPWGRPYKLVRKKLTSGGPPTTERLEPEFLSRVVDTLFPPDEGEVASIGRPPVLAPVPFTRDVEISMEELGGEVRRLRKKTTAPGPDGVPARALALASEVLGEGVRSIYNSCLGTGCFPSSWKTARLVLIPKEGKPEGSPSAYRPICLLDEAGKLFERLIAARLRRHLSGVGPDLVDSQFGFREGRSTVDAILRVRTLAEEAVSRGGVAIAVSLDIANAFNSLPWECIRRALEYHEVPSYLREVVGDYLNDRYIMYTGRYGEESRRETRRGVPQGSVLGPLLWNLGYDWVLRGVLLPGLSVTCYADDTLILARGDTWDQAIRLAETGTAHIVHRIRALGLRVALDKTEALWFSRPGSRGLPPQTDMRIEEEAVRIGSTMKYLGIVLDSRWSFAPHIERMAPRIRAATNSLSRLMPNLGGPGDRARRLYMGVVRSIALYGAPAWHDKVLASRRCLQTLEGVQRRLAIRVMRGYRTISFEAACVVAGSMPWALVVGIYADLYQMRRALREGHPLPGDDEEEEEDGHTPPPPDKVRRVLRRRGALLRQQRIIGWQESLEHARSGLYAVGALRPVLVEWVGRRHGSLGYRLAQMLTNHGCFGEYLRRIQREVDGSCHHCDAPEDTARHTLEDCPAWAEERRALRDIIGNDVSLPALVRAMVEGEEQWQAVVSFCERVMSQKEAAEREREELLDAPPARRRRGGRALRRYARNAP